MRQIFKDPELEKTFRRDGYFLFGKHHSIDVEALREDYFRLEQDYEQGMHMTMLSPNPKVRQGVNEILFKHFTPIIEDLLIDYEPVIGNFIVKEPYKDNFLNVHQDWAFVDEAEFETINFWVPLQDVNEKNGCLRFLKGSHACENYYRAPNIPFPFEDQVPQIEEKMDTLVMAAGELEVHAHRIVHSSFLNLTNLPRIGITFTSKPKEAKLLHYYRPDVNKPLDIEVYEVEIPYFYDYKICEKPRNAKFIKAITIPEPKLIVKEEVVPI